MLRNMKKTYVLLLCFGFVLASCSKGSADESSNSIPSSTSNLPSQSVDQSDDIKSIDDLLEVLASEGLECKNLRPATPEELGIDLNAVSEGYCDLGESQLHIAIFKNRSTNTKEMKKAIDSICPTAKALGISSVDYVDGGLWEIDNGTTAQLKAIAEKLDAEYQSVDC